MALETSVARVRWTANRYSASSRDGALRKCEPGWGGRQRNALCSVISHTFRGAGTSVARVRWTARYASAIAGGTDVFAVCGGVLRMRTTDSERGPSWYHLGAI